MRKSPALFLFLVLATFAGCRQNQSEVPSTASSASFVTRPPAQATDSRATDSRAATVRTTFAPQSTVASTVVLDAKDTNSAAPQMPNPHLTPGDALDVTAADICVRGYSKKVRKVPQSLKEKVYLQYGITNRQKGEYEVDHLISLELGGSNSVRNLWPQSYKTPTWNAHVKDKLENYLHAQICSGKMDIKVAQREIATDWISAYRKYFGEPGSAPFRDETSDISHRGYRKRIAQRVSRAQEPSTRIVIAPPADVPLSSGTPAPSYQPPSHQPSVPTTQAPTAQSSQVWVNTKTGIYHYPGTRWYGNTKQGEYLSEAAAEAAGYRAAQNGQ